MDPVSEKIETVAPVKLVVADDVSTKLSVKERFIQCQAQFLISLKTSRIKKFRIGLIGGLIFIVAAAVFYTPETKHVPIKQFTNVYSFVPEKISKSAVIPITVPAGISEDVAKPSLSFSPEVDGQWEIETEPGIVVFKPSEPLRAGVYYAVNMDTGLVQMSGDFYVDEDPQIEAIFPVAGSETNEDTEITIVFNRPMVPLTTLTEQDMIDLPVTISPATPGRFKWVSTRNLQFIPETTLLPASQYVVDIEPGFTSIDGLPVAPRTHSFITRPLRYTHVSSEQIGYREPIIVAFNQPVDLSVTKNYIKVATASGESVAIEVEYGERGYYDDEKNKYVTVEDKSKLFVYQKRDTHGRRRLWDFATTYKVEIGGAVPLTGTNKLEEDYNSVVVIPDIVASVKADSEKTSLVGTDLFDPSGTLAVTFYDDIDIKASTITAKGLREIEYGERCRASAESDQDDYYYGGECIEEPDTKTLIFTFDANTFGQAETFTIDLKKIKTPDGFVINADSLAITLKTYPTFSILRTLPEDGARTAPLDGLFICSNTPLAEPGEAGLQTYVKTEGYIVFGRWSDSWLVEEDNYYNYGSGYFRCQPGEFQTKLSYGLLPETDYALTLEVMDAFGQKSIQGLSFKTMAPTEQYTRFHNMQKQYNVTAPGKTKFTYAVENLEYVDMHICKLSAENFLERTLFRDDSSIPVRSDECVQMVNKRIELPPRYWVNNYFQINLADHFTSTLGHYIITFSNPLYQDSYQKKQLYDRTYVSVTNLAVGQKKVEYFDYPWSQSSNEKHNVVLDKTAAVSSNLYWISDSTTLEPVIGAVVTQYQGSDDVPFTRMTGGFSNDKGIALAPVAQDMGGAVVRSGADSAIITDWADTLSYASWTTDSSRTYVYTDRPIYRPGHVVHIRGIDRIGFDGLYELSAGEAVKLEVFDTSNKSIYNTTLKQSLYGTFDTEFTLPPDAPLGMYRIEVYGQNFYFSVEEYVPAAFKLEVTSSKDEYLSGETVSIAAQADYYFGVPLDGGTVSYSVTAQDYYFDKYTDEYFNFGSDWYYCYDCGYGDDFLFRGEASLNEQGRAVIEETFDLKEYFDDESIGSKIVTLSLTAKDVNGRAVSMQKSFVVHQAEYYLGLKTSEYYTSADTAFDLLVKTVDVTGESLSVRNLEYVVYKVDWETYKRQEVDGGFYYRSEKKLQEVAREKFATDGTGDWKKSITLADAGQYEIQVIGKTKQGDTLKTITQVYLFGEEAVTVPPNNNYELELELKDGQLEVGDTASLLIKSPYPKAKALVSIERGTVFDYQVVDVIGGLYEYKFPVKAKYAPNVFVSVLLLSPNPEVKYGNVYYEIGTAEKMLSIAVTPNKLHYLPGEEVTLMVKTTDHTGQGVPAEVSLAVADLSVLALKGNPKKNPIRFFYDSFSLSVTTASNIKNILHEVDVPLGTKGGGGSNPDDLAKKKRGLFKDTAFWDATVETNLSGEATATFTLPDNLTTWQIEAVGVTKDTTLGVAYLEFTTKKDLMAVPLKPRFVVPGDTFSLGAKVFNQTEEDARVEVILESDTLQFMGDTSTTVAIKAGETKTVYFPVTAPESKTTGEHSFTFTATDGDFIDSVEQTIAITANDTYETVATANVTKGAVATEYLYVPGLVVEGKGGLTINANATLAVFMSDALSYMATYPYGCSEQLASSLSTIGIIKKALALPNVAGELEEIVYQGVTYTVEAVVSNGLTKIYQAQTQGGGFTYYKGLKEELELTLHVVNALLELKAAGFVVDEAVLARALSFTEQKALELRTYFLDSNRELVILAEFMLKKAGLERVSALHETIETIIADKAFLNEEISSVALAHLAILTTSGYSRKQKDLVYETFLKRIDVDGRGAYLKNGPQTSRFYYETPIKNTALAVQVFTAHKDEHVMLPNLLRWLLASRDSKGVWGGTHNTFSVVNALVDYLTWTHETESHFTLKGLLAGVTIFEHEFSPVNVFKSFTQFLPIDAIPKEQLLPLTFEKTEKNDKASTVYYDMALRYFLPVDSLPPRDEGITITRDLYVLKDTVETKALTEAKQGDIVRGRLTLTIPGDYEHVAIEDIIPAGFEIVNFNLATEDQSLQNESTYVGQAPLVEGQNYGLASRFWQGVRNALGGRTQLAQVYQQGGGYYDDTASQANKRTLYPTHTEAHDDRIFLYVENLNPGVYEYEYFLRALVPGTFQHLPARAEEMYFPEIFGRTSGGIFTITAE